MNARQSPDLDELYDKLSAFFKDLPKNTRKSVVDVKKTFLKDFKEVYMESGIITYYDDYLRRATLITMFSFLFFALLSLIVHSFFFQFPFSRLILAIFAISITGSGITGFFLLFYPYYQRNQAKGLLEDGLIYSTSYMAVLSASGMPIEKILERIIEVEDNAALTHLAKKFIMNLKLFGMDIQTALRDIANMSPSKTLSKQIESIRTAIATSGDLKSLLVYEVGRQLQVKKEKLKAKVNSLVYVGEIYVSLMVVTPTLFILVIAILSVMGGRAPGANPVLQLNLIVFFGIPLLGVAFIILLDQVMGREE